MLVKELQSLGLSVELLHEDEEQPMLAEPSDELTIDGEILSEMEAMEWVLDVEGGVGGGVGHHAPHRRKRRGRPVPHG